MSKRTAYSAAKEGRNIKRNNGRGGMKVSDASEFDIQYLYNSSMEKASLRGLLRRASAPVGRKPLISIDKEVELLQKLQRTVR
ncbi:hypothetical protein MASR2M39_31240 [Ignavibacteriales bacterium]